MKVRKIKCRIAKSSFVKLSCEEKLKVLKELSRESKKIHNDVVKPTKGKEDKYYKISKCINECGAEELKFIKTELKKDKITFSKLDSFLTNTFPLVISVFSLLVSIFNGNVQSTVQTKPWYLGLSLFVYLALYFLCYLISGRIVESNVKKTAYILEIINSKNH